MWSDNASSQDFLNFGVLAKVIADTIERNGDRPLSIGVSGVWGVGKSTTLELLAAELERQNPKPIVVRFHPWRHQTQDNVRASFAECIAKTLIENSDPKSTVAKKAKSILKRANLIRIASYGLGGALTLATGIPIGGFFSKGAEAIGGVLDGDVTAEDATKAADFADEARRKYADLFPEGKESQSPYENIEKICQDFAETLEALDRRLIVLIDDLDRCLPNTTIEALEAMRLYFFVPRTVFVIAADEEMLRLAVRKHFEVSDQTLDENHLQSYYDKLIQLPFRIPSLTVPDAIVYMTLLVLDQQSSLSEKERETIRADLCELLARTWDGTRISRASVMEAVGEREVSPDFEDQISLIVRLAPKMVHAKKIGGNPRLIKRFMNSLMVRDSLAKAIKVPDETNQEVLAKILLLQRCGEKELVSELQRDVLNSPKGHSAILARVEQTSGQVTGGTPEKSEDREKKNVAPTGAEVGPSKLWETSFAVEWLEMEPKLAEIDLRPAFYVSRGADEVIAQSVKLGDKTRDLVKVLIEKPDIADKFREQIEAIPDDEVETVMSTLINHLRQSSKEDFPERLRSCVTFETIHGTQSSLLKSTLLGLQTNRWHAGSVSIVAKRPWAKEFLSHLKRELGDKSPAVKSLLKAMES